MKRTGTLLLVLLIAVAFGTQVWAGGQSASGSASAPAAKPLTKVNVGVHRNGAGASAVAVALEKGFFKDYGIDAQVTIVESGPVEMAAMRADTPTLDIGYIGPGVAWNPIDPTGNSLSFVFFDDLGNSERLLAKKGIFTRNSSGQFDYPALYNGLKGKTVYLEIGTTPGGWFKNLVDAINQGYAAGDQLWLQCEDSSYLAGYTAPNSNPANKVLVVNYANANLPAGMASAGSVTVDIAVGFEPAPSTILKNVSNAEMVADINNLPKDKVFPATFLANTKWLTSNPDLAKNCIYAIYKAAQWRAANLDESMRAAERLCAMPEGTFVANAYFFPGTAEYKAWFADTNSAGYGYLRSLYNSSVPNIPKGATPKAFEQAVDFTYMLQAIKEISN